MSERNKAQDAVRNFITNWSGRGSEKSDGILFWIDLLAALGLENIPQAVQTQRPVDVNGRACFIDVLIPSTKVLIEHKSRGVDLDKPARQSDGSFMTPFDQAKRYADALPYSQRPRWIVTCNFDEFRVYDMDSVPVLHTRSVIEPRVIKFKYLVVEYEHLKFLVDPNDDNIEEVRISLDAVNIIERIRESFARKMLAPRKPKGDPLDHLTAEQKDVLNKFCVRLVFCLYAEDAGIFQRNQFIDYIVNAANQRRALADLFKVLGTPKDRRDPNLNAELAAFEYVDGGLFEGDDVIVPPFDSALSDSISLEANDDRMNWFAINPTIFGAMFESTLNDDTRRAGGVHYTSRANIHKLIAPLFLDELQDEFDAVKRKTKKNRVRALKDFQNKLASLKFLDPACGSGNFLTETYIKLRELENNVLRELLKFDAVCTVKVSIDQFYGIEINDFAVAVAETAMWISENKMLYDTDVGIREHIDYLPLKHSARIVCGNALTLDWNEIVPEGVDYIIGNPPFSGARYMTVKNKNDLLRVFDGWQNAGNLDFVSCWFKKATDFMVDTEIRAAFVATNSIVQGESVSVLWARLFETVHIDFARRTFRWTHDSDDPEKTAAVHCVIIGFSVAPNARRKIIFDGDKKIVVTNINGYLMDAPNYFVGRRRTPLCDTPTMRLGNMAADGGHLTIEADEIDDFIQREPRAKHFIRRYMMGREFINGELRYCLWLADATKDDIRSMPLVAERVEKCRKHRSNTDCYKKLAATPHLFREQLNPAHFIVVPVVSSERRRYVPIGYLNSDVIAGDKLFMIVNASLYHFGVLTSSVHMTWMRTICGRLKSDYSYSKTLVYNNFPWCERSTEIERTAQSILDARALYPTWTLAALYDEQTMPPELRAAHLENDRAVMSAYNFDQSMTESEIVARLMEMYQSLMKSTTIESVDEQSPPAKK